MQNEPARVRQAVERPSVGAIVDEKLLEEGRSSQPGHEKSLKEARSSQPGGEKPFKEGR